MVTVTAKPRRMLAGISLFFSATLIAGVVVLFTGDVEVAGIVLAADMVGNILMFVAGGMFFTSLPKGGSVPRVKK